MGRHLVVKTVASLTTIALAFGCSKAADNASSSAPTTLYVSTGACNAGFGAAAMSTYTSGSAIPITRTIERFSPTSGANQGFLVDFNISNFLAGMSPQAILDNGDSVYVEMENATTATERSILKMPKADPLSFVKYYTNATTFSGVLRGLALDSDQSFITGVTTKLERINAQPVRVPAGANPWVNAPAGTCATATTGMSAVQLMPPLAPAINGKIIFAHQSTIAGAATQRLGIINSGGYFGAADCANGYQISSTSHSFASTALGTGTATFNANGTSPTAMIFISTGTSAGKLIVAYSNDQNGNNAAGTYNLNHAIVQWDVAETSATAAALSNPVVLYDNTSVIYGVSAMAYDATSGLLYVATGGEPGVANMATNGVGYNIEKFALDYTTPTLTRISSNNMPFIKGASNTRCISGMALGQ